VSDVDSGADWVDAMSRFTVVVGTDVAMVPGVPAGGHATKPLRPFCAETRFGGCEQQSPSGWSCCPVILVDDAAKDPFAPYGRVEVDHDPRIVVGLGSDVDDAD
jgi:hypothetical protein